MSRGLMRIKLLGATIYPEWRYPNNNILILNNGGQTQQVGLSMINGEQVWMEYMSNSLYLFLKNNNDSNSQEFGEAEIRLGEMIKFQNTIHRVNVYVSMKDAKKGWMQKDAALIVLEIYYSKQQIFGGRLRLVILNAELFRDTQLVGKMDPYVLIKTGLSNLKTTVKKNAGKTPLWQESFDLLLQGINQKVQLIVYDKDVMTDDEIGRCSFTIRQLGFRSRDLVNTLDLVYTKKNGNLEHGGRLRIRTIIN